MRGSARPLKILLVGDTAIGKTKLVKRYLDPTIYASDAVEDGLVELHHITVIQNEKPVPIVIYDAPAGHDNVNINKNMYSNADVIILCFDICDKKTLTSIKDRWIPELRSADCAKNYQFILVGLKEDDRERQKLFGSRRGQPGNTVSFESGQSVCEEIKSCVYLECSSKTGDGVKKVFEVATLLASRRKQLRKSWFVDFDLWNKNLPRSRE